MASDCQSDSIRILIADDHSLFRDGLRKLLDAEPGFLVVGEARDGNETVRFSRALCPDILLLDIAMPRCSGMQALRDLASSHSSVRTIVVAAEISKGHALEALQLGAYGIVLKELSIDLLVHGIRSVMAGQYWLENKSASSLVQALHELASPSDGKPSRNKFGLTPRELQIISTIGSGYTNKDIAQKFSVSENTVKHHLINIFDKTGVSSRLELALFAGEHHLLDRL